MSLVQTWLAAGKAAGFKSNSEILRDLNQNTGLNVLNNRLYEWRKGTVGAPVVATNYMLKASILYALRQVRPRIKLTQSEINQLCELLKLPEGSINGK